ncbi:MAG: hypothetical protein LBM96_05905 [Methanobrevibacter sp.]|jgi:hypothetical protein|nr:hypothetical protein [Candidatus Methanoflexus mossambicus]
MTKEEIKKLDLKQDDKIKLTYQVYDTSKCLDEVEKNWEEIIKEDEDLKGGEPSDYCDMTGCDYCDYSVSKQTSIITEIESIENNKLNISDCLSQDEDYDYSIYFQHIIDLEKL